MSATGAASPGEGEAALPEPFASALAAIEAVVAEEPEADDVLRRTVAILGERIPHYTWLGLYFVEEQDLVLGPWSGAEPSAHPRLPIADGPIGRSVARAACEIVADVALEPGYAACFAWTRSELDQPVVFGETVVAVLGIDSDRIEAFGRHDQAFLGRVAGLIAGHCLVGWDTGGVAWEELE